MIKKITLLLVSIGLAIVATFIQQLTSSDRPHRKDVVVNDTLVKLDLPVIYEGDDIISIAVPDTSIKAYIFYKHLNIEEQWEKITCIRMGGNIESVIPFHKPNTKLQYFLELVKDGKSYFVAKNNPVVLRFQDLPPKYLMFPYVILMFVALTLACFSGILAILKSETYKKMVAFTFYLVLAATLLSLIIHLVTFKHLLIQISVHNDISFYKNLVIMILWGLLFYMNKKYALKVLTTAISVITLLLYCLPQHFISKWLL
jgi:hypothetical protein